MSRKKQNIHPSTRPRSSAPGYQSEIHEGKRKEKIKETHYPSAICHVRRKSETIAISDEQASLLFAFPHESSLSFLCCLYQPNGIRSQM